VKLAIWGNEEGASLVEVLVAVAIMAIVFTIFLSALSTGSFGVATVRERVTAENIARSQLEYVKETGFITGTNSYTPTTIAPIGYAATISATTIYPGVQLITVTVYHNGPVFTLEDYKVDR